MPAPESLAKPWESATLKIEWLKVEVKRLYDLLDDPEPGLFTWLEAYCRQQKRIMAFWTDQPIPEEYR